MFVGYPQGVKGYRLYNLHTRKFYVSRDLVFHESIFPFQTLPNSSQEPDFLSELAISLPIPEPITSNIQPRAIEPNTSKLDHPIPPDTSDFPIQLSDSTVDTTIGASSTLSSPPLRRSIRTSNPPPYLSDYIRPQPRQRSHPIQDHCSLVHLNPLYKDFIAQVSTTYEPQFYHQAVLFPEWHQAITTEIKALESDNTWTLVPFPAGKQCIGCRWVYKVKFKPDGIVDRHKARLVAKGYTQQAGINFSDTFSPIAKLTSVRVLLAVATAKNWSILQLDMDNAFLNGNLF